MSTGATPLSNQLRMDWGLGVSSSAYVLRTAKNAAGQGAHSLEKLASHTNPDQNSMRDVKRALGWPEGAPDVKFIDIPLGAGGTEKPHAIFCPIEAAEKLSENIFGQ